LPYPKRKKRKKFRAILEEQYGKGLPFAVYRKPEGVDIRAILQEDALLDTELDLSRPGFHIAPFNDKDTPAVCIRADRSYLTDCKGQLPKAAPAAPLTDTLAREIHMQLVQKSIEALKKGILEKVVVSRRFSLAISGDVLDIFFHLTRTFPKAFSYIWYHPEAGTWLGATPERLLRYHSGMAETIALAGTRPSDSKDSAPVWTEKERHEQALVTRFILDQIDQKNMHPETGSVKNVRAGKVWHLGTDIRVSSSREQAVELLKVLHPTPAVCGIPRETASDFIRRNENFNREYYTGYLGEVGMEEEDSFEFYVNLRCIQLRNRRAYVYVGGGITEDSDPLAEWEETQQKSTTMLSGLRNSL
jgi:isochorismate synthase